MGKTYTIPYTTKPKRTIRWNSPPYYDDEKEGGKRSTNNEMKVSEV